MLAGYKEIEMFTTSIYSEESARMTITFDPEVENGIFPYMLKIKIEDFMMGIGSYHVYVSGVGQGILKPGGQSVYKRTWTVVLKGYNYDQLMAYAEELKTRLMEHPRIQEAYIMGSGERFRNRKITRNRMSLDDSYLAKKNSDIRFTY